MERIASRVLPERILKGVGLPPAGDRSVVELAATALRHAPDYFADILPYLSRPELRRVLGEGDWDAKNPKHVVHLYRVTLLDVCEFDLAMQIIWHLRAFDVLRRPGFVYRDHYNLDDLDTLIVDVSLRIMERVNEGHYSLSKEDRFITPAFLRDYAKLTFGMRGLRLSSAALPQVWEHAARVERWVRQDMARPKVRSGTIPRWETPGNHVGVVKTPKDEDALANVISALRRRRLN